MNTLNELKIIFEHIFNVNNINISLNTPIGGLEGWDSFKNVEILIACEDNFNIRFSSQEIDSIASIGSLVQLIEKKR